MADRVVGRGGVGGELGVLHRRALALGQVGLLLPAQPPPVLGDPAKHPVCLWVALPELGGPPQVRLGGGQVAEAPFHLTELGQHGDVVGVIPEQLPEQLSGGLVAAQRNQALGRVEDDPPLAHAIGRVAGEGEDVAGVALSGGHGDPTPPVLELHSEVLRPCGLQVAGVDRPQPDELAVDGAADGPRVAYDGGPQPLGKIQDGLLE